MFVTTGLQTLPVTIGSQDPNRHPYQNAMGGLANQREVKFPAADTAELESTEHVTPPDSAEGGW
jgi:hypothetical protein